MKLTDMKRSKPKPSELKANYPNALDEGDDYPYGLRLRLEDKDLEKMGIDLYDVGEDCNVTAVGRVISASESADQRGSRRSMEIQITKLSLAPVSEKKDGLKTETGEGMKDYGQRRLSELRSKGSRV